MLQRWCVLSAMPSKTVMGSVSNLRSSGWASGSQGSFAEDWRVKVAVLSGGISGEREVSLMSGTNVLGALQKLGHDTSMVDFGPGAAEELRRLGPDLVFPVLHGPLGEDGTAAALLEVLGLAYVGSGILAGALAMNKAAAKRVWKAEGLPTPRFAV